MFNNEEFGKHYLLTADDTFVKCMNIHQDICNFELVLQRHGITTFHEMSVMIDSDLYYLRWAKHNNMFRLSLGRYANDSIFLNECDNYIKKEVFPYLSGFLDGLIKEINKHEPVVLEEVETKEITT